MAGRLIVFEGTDGSGKSTQFHLACQALKAAGREFRTCVYPQYQEESSALIRMYLGGKFGTHPSDVNAYAASTFFAVDRYAGYKQHWGSHYENGGLMLLDRYTTSNAVHQSSKLSPAEREAFFRWLADFEYGALGLPAPDLVLWLDMPIPPGGGQPAPPGAGHPHHRRHPRGGHRLPLRLPGRRRPGRGLFRLAAHLLRGRRRGPAPAGGHPPGDPLPDPVNRPGRHGPPRVLKGDSEHGIHSAGPRL